MRTPSINLLNALPGLGLFSIGVICISALTEQFSTPILDPLLIALFTGILFGSVFPNARWHRAGTEFAARYVLEFSIMILGASIAFDEVLKPGTQLFALIGFGVLGSLILAYFVGHIVLKLSSKMAILIGVSNSICGNSAAIVIAPIIRANATELSSVIAISGLLGAAQIVLLPLLAAALGLSDYHYGIVAGMAVYAVAQVYAASAVVSSTSASVATFVKLSRVLLLVPIVIIIDIFLSKRKPKGSTHQLEMKLDEGGAIATFRSITFQRYIPWFVSGFFVLAICRSIGIIEESLGNQLRDLSKQSFLFAMIAIGIGVNIRDVIHVGPRVACTILCILIFLITVSVVAGKLYL
jgi:uncharacterized integral membrane protein (TIGR00698 family)